MIQQESGGRAGVRGQMTQYGQPIGIGQTLPATAREMSGVLGIPYREDLLSGTSAEAEAYQRRVSRAYLAQGYNRERGDPRRTAMYYHGGPNTRMWGLRTRRYADEVTRRAGF